ncbi:hypothetical protein AtNW77_Chr5g0153651 [Arabidopsis thaliana]|uniref:Uncharacterized protein n=1 Tax=Arabidopsis thaliana x Arabidopsis arenosa TaxID=1240361 RepID=A0A8T2DB06_9BRAS|nr:hypothetical protein ISN45_At05g062970 [Arabidopsis thaliana x Arabidopsis arenosa]
MPTFSAAALGRSLNSGTSLSSKFPSTLQSKPSILNDESKQPKEKTFTRPQMSPSLYATTKEIPHPNSPSSYPPSPYIINHKARGPVLFNRDSEVDGPSHPITSGEEKISGNVDVEATASLSKSTSLSFPITEAIAVDHTNGVHTQGIHERPVWDCSPPLGTFLNEKSGRDISNGGIGSNNATSNLEWQSYLLEPVRIKVDKELEPENFYNPGELVSFTSNTEVEDFERAESSHSLATHVGEFYDACDELSTDSGMQSSANNIESEVREMRLGLLMEIERRRQAEATLEQMQVHWRRLRDQLADVGMFLPLDPTRSQYSMNLADELRCQLEVTRFVSDTLGSDLAKTEVEMEMEAELEAKNFEITRLSDRLHYYETVNQEMSQRNQEAIEVARRDGQKRKRRQRWIWGSIAATITLGSGVLAWSYLPPGMLSSDEAQPQLSPKDS